MARKVFFSFHYQRDIWRACNVRNSGIVEGQAAAGFSDASIWEEAKKKGDSTIKKMIDDALVGTSVTAVLIGAETAYRKYVNYEIEKSVERGNGILGIRIHNIKDQNEKTDPPGNVPMMLLDGGYSIYTWDRDKFGDWVEDAYKQVQEKKAREAQRKSFGTW
jgi:hypothetical protein